MTEKILKYENLPFGFMVCFNSDCKLCDTCMHYQAGLLQPEGKLSGHAVFPQAWKSGTCKNYLEKKIVRKAWGFNHIYKNVPHYRKAEARMYVKNYFSSGNGPYYRYHHGENLLSPKQQEDIMKILAGYGSTEDLAFDHYVTDFDFG